MNAYEVLGISSSSSLDEIKSAYRSLARKYHPDMNGGSKKAEEQFKRVNSAYQSIVNNKEFVDFSPTRKKAANTSATSKPKSPTPKTQPKPKSSPVKRTYSFEYKGMPYTWEGFEWNEEQVLRDLSKYLAEQRLRKMEKEHTQRVKRMTRFINKSVSVTAKVALVCWLIYILYGLIAIFHMIVHVVFMIR